MRIDTFFKKGQKFLGCAFPIICGAMTWISDHKLVSAVGNAGGFGMIAGGNLPAEDLRKEIAQTREHTDKPFGVNLITGAACYREQLEIVCASDCRVIMFAGAFPRKPEIQMARDAGAKVICSAPTAPWARRLIRMGVDALLLEGSEAGGHIGPVSLSVLIQQILFGVETLPIFVAGGIATGRMMAHLLMMGAAGIQMGTKFVMSTECKAHPNFKEAFKNAKAREAVSPSQMDRRLPVIPVRILKNEAAVAFSKLQLDLLKKLEINSIPLHEAQSAVECFWAGALKKAALDGDIETGSLMAGQSVGLVDKIQSVREIIDEMIATAEKEVQRLHHILNPPDEPGH